MHSSDPETKTAGKSTALIIMPAIALMEGVMEVNICEYVFPMEAISQALVSLVYDSSLNPCLSSQKMLYSPSVHHTMLLYSSSTT